MAQLPHVDRAVIPQAKITHYLLDLTSKQGRSKARFFLAFGFTIEAWQVMADALKRHALSYEVVSIRETPYGKHYSIEGVLQTPDARNPKIRSVWKIETGTVIPVLVTAYPLDENEA